MARIVTIALCAIATFIAISALGIASTEMQAGKYFGLPVYTTGTPEQIEQEILAQLPVGSSRSAVEAFLNQHEIGADGNSVCREQGDRLLCRIGVEQAFWKPVRETYSMRFDFTDEQRLCAVNVWSEYFWFGGRLKKIG